MGKRADQGFPDEAASVSPRLRWCICGGVGVAAALFLSPPASRALATPCEPDAIASTGVLPANFRISAVGDIIIQHPAAALIRARAPQIARLLSDADLSFGNFESNSFELGSPAAHARAPADGPLVLAPPVVARELRALGFRLVSAANNHAGDWGPGGVLETLGTLRKAGIVSAGTGATLAAARSPSCVRVRGAAVALIAVTSTFAKEDAATAERPGVNALHLSLQSGNYVVSRADLQALLAAIRAARRSAALVLVSLHTHEPGTDAQHPPAFEVQLAHAAIDAGADAFIGHGPHTLRGIEIRQGKPIFYSLGNFAVMQPLEQINPMPMKIPPGSIFTRREFFEGALISARYDRGRLRTLVIQPFELSDSPEPASHGLPVAATAAQADAILERLADLSRDLGTTLAVADGVGVVQIATPVSASGRR